MYEGGHDCGNGKVMEYRGIASGGSPAGVFCCNFKPGDFALRQIAKKHTPDPTVQVKSENSQFFIYVVFGPKHVPTRRDFDCDNIAREFSAEMRLEASRENTQRAAQADQQARKERTLTSVGVPARAPRIKPQQRKGNRGRRGAAIHRFHDHD